MEALVSLKLSELKWLESRMRSLRQSFLHCKRLVPPAFTIEEEILGEVLLAFFKKYLDWEKEKEPSFLALDEEVFNEEAPW